MNSKIVYVVHCVDAEGPLYESLPATFLRLQQVFGIELEPTHKNLVLLVSGEIPMGEQSEEIREFVSDHNIKNHGTWQEIDTMLEEITETEFRNSYPDSFGNGWIYNWFCVDHVGYVENPRKRDLGYHKIFDHYRELTEQEGNTCDSVGFHYHPLPYNRLAHSCGSFYFNQNHLYEILAKRIIDRYWFPSIFRPGFHTIRPDSNWFLEQWIPFDFSNQASRANVAQPDLAGGRYGDWRRAPTSWSAYHPDIDDYQVPGACRRWIFRCLNMWARLRQIEQKDVDEAFEWADRNGSALLAFTDHDFRDMKADVQRIWNLIINAAEKNPDVRFCYKDAVNGARAHLGLERTSKIGLKLDLTHIKENTLFMRVTSKNNLFGPQPFLAVKTKDRKYCYDNFDFDIDPRSWHYTFDWQTFLPGEIDKIGVAASNSSGLVEIVVHDLINDRQKEVLLNTH